LWNEGYYEKKYKLKTAGFQNSESKLYHHYQAASYRVLFQIFNRLTHLQSEFSFYDIGCGKGRVLFVAGMRGFKHIYGIEMNPKLLELAKTNLETLNDDQKIRIHFSQENALDFNYDNRKAIYFLFNPFNAEILEQVLDRILLQNKQACYFVYMNPIHKAVFYRKKITEKERIRNFLYTEAIIFYSPEPSSAALV